MSKGRWWVIGWVLIWLINTVFLFSCKVKEKSSPDIENTETRINKQIRESPQEGFLAPSFSLQNLKGPVVNLIDYRGKVVLLNFWASWCGPCKMEIPALKRLYQLRKGPNFEIIAISLDKPPASKVTAFVKGNQMDFPVLLNPDGDIGDGYWVRGIPASFLLDKKGMIRWKAVGGREWDGPDVLNRIDQLLAEKAE